MRNKDPNLWLRAIVPAVFALVIALAAPSASSAAPLTFCGVVAAANVHTVAGTCIDAVSGAKINGTATEIVTATSDTITVSASINCPITSPAACSNQAGLGYALASNSYTFVPPAGPGILTASYDVDWLENPLAGPFGPADGKECYQGAADATTFVVTPAIAVKTCVPNGTLDSFELMNNASVNGNITGPGTLTAYAAFYLEPGESFVLPETVETAVPEPSSVALVAFAIVTLTLALRKSARTTAT